MALYSNEQLDRALAYLDERLGLQRSATNALQKRLKAAALEIALISQKYQIAPSRFKFSSNRNLKKEVDAVISRLVDDLYDDICMLIVNGESDDEINELLGQWIVSERYGKTLRQRVSQYAKRFEFEIEPAIAAALLMGKSAREVANVVAAALKAPYTSYLMRTAKEEGLSPIRSQGVTYGNGRYASVFNNLNRVAIDAIGVARSQAFFHEEKTLYGTNAWFVRRGSSYPCSICDIQVGVHNHEFDLPPYHPNCVCLAIPLKVIE